MAKAIVAVLGARHVAIDYGYNPPDQQPAGALDFDQFSIATQAYVGAFEGLTKEGVGITAMSRLMLLANKGRERAFAAFLAMDLEVRGCLLLPQLHMEMASDGGVGASIGGSGTGVLLCRCGLDGE